MSFQQLCSWPGSGGQRTQKEKNNRDHNSSNWRGRFFSFGVLVRLLLTTVAASTLWLKDFLEAGVQENSENKKRGILALVLTILLFKIELEGFWSFLYSFWCPLLAFGLDQGIKTKQKKVNSPMIQWYLSSPTCLLLFSLQIATPVFCPVFSCIQWERKCSALDHFTEPFVNSIFHQIWDSLVPLCLQIFFLSFFSPSFLSGTLITCMLKCLTLPTVLWGSAYFS